MALGNLSSCAPSRRDTAAKRPAKQVKVVHNGETKHFPFDKDELTSSLLEKARQAFRITNNPHLFGLFRLDMNELDDTKTLHANKVKAGAKLFLRQSTVRGG